MERKRHHFVVRYRLDGSSRLGPERNEQGRIPELRVKRSRDAFHFRLGYREKSSAARRACCWVLDPWGSDERASINEFVNSRSVWGFVIGGGHGQKESGTRVFIDLVGVLNGNGVRLNFLRLVGVERCVEIIQDHELPDQKHHQYRGMAQSRAER